MMQKYFTKEIAQPFKIVVLGLAIGLGVSFVSANWTAPSSTAPNCPAGQPGCDAPINVSSSFQVKGPVDPNNPVQIPAMLYIKQIFGADHVVAVKSLNAGSLVTPLLDGNANVYGQLAINRTNSTGTSGTDLLFLKGGTPSADYVSVLQNKPWFQIWNDSDHQRAGLLARSAKFDIDAQDQDTLIQANRGGVPGFIVDPGYVAGSVVDVTVNGRLKISDGTQGAGKVFTSDANGLGSWGSLPTIPIPDIKIVEESWADVNDGQSKEITCPADYAPIAVTCDSNKDDGTDTCFISDGGHSYDYNGRQTQNDSGYVTSFTNTAAVDYNFRGGIISPANDNANIHIWLTCIRYKNYPVLALVSGSTPPPAPTPATWHLASTQPSSPSASQCIDAYANTVPGKPTFTASEVAYVQVQDTMAYSGSWMLGTPPATPPAANVGLCITGSGIAASQLPSGATWAANTVGNVTPGTNATPAKRQHYYQYLKY